MRLVVFGSPGRHAEVIDAHRGMLTRLLAGEPVTGASAEAVGAGLLRYAEGGLALGPRVLRAPQVPGDVLTAAGADAAGLVAKHLPVVRRAAPAPWESVALLVIGGLLLDVFVGEWLRRTGTVGPVGGGWRLWAMARPPAVTVGMRCDHDGDIGAGVLWVSTDDHPTPLAVPTDLATVLDPEAPGARRATATLRLRQNGWLAGQRQSFLLLEPDDPLWTALDAAATELVASIYQPLLAPHGTDAALMLSRMIMEHCLAELAGTVSVGDARRLAWRGPDWVLFAEAVKDGDHARR